MIIIQAPNGNIGSHLIRIIHMRWPDYFQFHNINNWKNDRYLPDLALQDPHLISESETESFANLLSIPSLVRCINTLIIPTQLLNQVPTHKIFYLTRSNPESEIKTVFLQWLGNSTNQFDQADSHRDQVDFYQNLWAQLSLHLLSVSPIDEIARSRIPEGQDIDFHDLGTYSAMAGLLEAVRQEFQLEQFDANHNDYADVLTRTYQASIHPIEFFQNHYLDFKACCERILERFDITADYRQVLDADHQQKFRNVMDFFAEYRGAWDWSDTVPEKLILPLDQYIS